jgi:hypothetical protein
LIQHRKLTDNERPGTDEPSWPEIVYKYRDYKALFHRNILTHRQLFLAPPSSFEDPLDCKNPIRYDLLSEEDIYRKYLHYSYEDPEHVGWSKQRHKKYARDFTKNSPIKDKGAIQKYAVDSFYEFDSRFGVLSLTEIPDSFRMWKKYSKEHTGFSVGFKPKIMFPFLGGGAKVEYCDDLPIILPNPKDEPEVQHYKQVFFKLKNWTFEQEYRTHKFSANGPLTAEARTIVMPAEAYSEIILGAKIDPAVKLQILSDVDTHLPGIKIRQAFLEGEVVKIIDL